MPSTIRLAGLCGSLRRDSFNRKLLLEAQRLLPEHVVMDILPIDDLPHYNGDLDLPVASERPRSVEQFRASLTATHGLVIASPEYNYSIPGVLKNAIDWASRGQDSPLLRKPVALLGATPGMWGTVRMQLAFLPVFQFLDMVPVQKPEMLVNDAAKKFDPEGRLQDAKTIELLQTKLDALIRLIEKIKND